MRLRVLFGAAAGLLGLVGLVASAQDPKPEPKLVLPPDVVPSTFRAFLVTDGRFPPLKIKTIVNGKEKETEQTDPRNRTGKIHCLVCEYGLSPVVAVFVRAEANKLGPKSGVAKLTKQLDALIPKYRADKLAGFVAFLNLEGGKKTIKIPGAEGGTEVTLAVDKEYPDDEKRDVYAKDIRDFATALNVPNVPFGLAADKSDAITAWKIPEKDADVTVVVYYRMRQVGKPWVFPMDSDNKSDLTDEKIAEILKSVETAITGRK
jgi:hypothetical protein